MAAERLAVAEQRLDRLEKEVQLGRDRWHSLQADRAAVRLLAREVTDLAERVGRMASSVEQVATDAATKAIAAFEEKRQDSNRDRLRTRLSLVGTGAAVATVLSVLVELLR